jgi:hypothetical protein
MIRKPQTDEVIDTCWLPIVGLCTTVRHIGQIAH